MTGTLLALVFSAAAVSGASGAVVQFIGAFLGGWAAGATVVRRSIEEHIRTCPARKDPP